MSVPDRSLHVPLRWTETLVSAGRGNVGTGLFDRVFFVDVFDGPKGQVQVRSLTPESGSLRLSQVISTGHEVALEEDRWPMLLVPQVGRIFCALGARDLVARPGQAMVLPRGRRRTVTLRDGDRLFRALVLRLPESGAGSALVNGGVVNFDDLPDLSAAAGLMAGLAPSGAGPASVMAERMRAVETLVGGALEGLVEARDGRLRATGTDLALRKAEALMRELAAEDITILEIADHAGLSMRQLQHLFATAYGLSPHAFLTRLRLELAHLRLKGARPAPSVTDAALSAGFSHLGRFPALYRRRFGTLPSTGRAALP